VADAPPAGYRVQVVIDCADAAAQTAFWCLALGYIEQPPPEGYRSWDEFADAMKMPVERRALFSAAVDPAGIGPRLFFHGVPEAKTVKNRLHLDVNIGGGLRGAEREGVVREHARRLQAAGARLVEERQDEFSWWIVLTDPEGNEFCLQ
jgi:hypothetical protein